MRAIRIEAVGRVAVSEVPDPRPGPGEAVVELRAAALNHRDVWIKLGQYAGLQYPSIPGSDGAGVVAAVGPGADGPPSCPRARLAPRPDSIPTRRTRPA